MGKKVTKLMNFVAWLTGILVSLAVGFAMIGGSLTIPWFDSVGIGVVTIIAGWVVVLTTVLSVILALLKQ